MISFIVSHNGLRLKVLVLPTIKDVHTYCDIRTGSKTSISKEGWTCGFFMPLPSGPCQGMIVLPRKGNLFYYVPHEVTHAVMNSFDYVTRKDDEEFAVTVGKICTKIFTKLRALGVQLW